MARTQYIPPTPAQRVAANHVAARSNLSKPAIKVFDVIVWMANGKTGQLNPSQELLADLTKVHVKTAPKAIKELCRAGFLKILRPGRPHLSAAYQVQWAVLEEAQRRWELEAFSAMERHKQLMADKARAYGAKMRMGMKRTDIIPSAMKCSPAIRRGYPQPNGGDSVCTPPQPNGGENSLELYEQNSLNTPSDNEGEPRPETGSPSLAEKKEASREETLVKATTPQPTQRPLNLLVAIKDGWERRGDTEGGDLDPRLMALARLEGRSARKPWRKPSLGGEEPRDLVQWPIEPGELAA